MLSAAGVQRSGTRAESKHPTQSSYLRPLLPVFQAATALLDFLEQLGASGELLAEFAAQNFARGRLGNAVAEVKFARLFIVCEAIGYEGA